MPVLYKHMIAIAYQVAQFRCTGREAWGPACVVLLGRQGGALCGNRIPFHLPAFGRSRIRVARQATRPHGLHSISAPAVHPCVQGCTGGGHHAQPNAGSAKLLVLVRAWF